MKLRIPAGARTRCFACGRCCRTTSVALTRAEAERLERSPPPDGRSPVRTMPSASGPSLHLRHRRGGACVYLGDSGLCVLQERQGFRAKPLACRLFPLRFLQTAEGLSVSLRFSCPAVAAGLGDRLQDDEAGLMALARELGETTGIRSLGETHPFDRARALPQGDLNVLRRHLLDLLGAPADGLPARVHALDEFLDLVASSSLDAGTRHRYWEALILQKPLVPPSPAGAMERSLYRQAAFGLSALGDPAALEASWARRSMHRIGRVARGTLYVLGGGSVDPPAGAEALRDVLARHGPSPGEGSRDPRGPLVNYLRHQVETHAHFADRPRPVTFRAGLQSMLLGVSFALRFARSGGEDPPSFDRVVEGLVRTADALSTPAASPLLGRGLSGRMLHRRGTVVRLLAWALDAEPGDPVRLVPGPEAP
jgi:Fe-S-cluster containining protein